ncbi:MAG: class I SAM-dependent methyltransferase [Bacillus sp. (in: Bacteria)]|nr:class I SAM-dependent methyltransferase [Bacillus sp. (in: firmicutes)]
MQHFAAVYDQLMEDVPYEDWLLYTKKHVKDGSTIVDLACGTGTLSMLLYEAGFSVTGIDISQDMLTVAEKKIREKQYPIKLFKQDMRKLKGFMNVDAVTIFCDGLNYLLKEEEVKDTFQRVRDILRPGGVFLFDVHSPFKIKEEFDHQLYGENGEVVSYLWFASPGQESNSVDHTLTFFIKEADDLYSRIDEEHSQRTFIITDYVKWLEEMGFDQIEVTADFGRRKPKDTDERYFFKGIKK